MKIGSADFARMYGDPDDDYDSFEKCVVRSIDALDSLAEFFDDFICDENAGAFDLDRDTIKDLESQKAVAESYRDRLREWSLGIPHHEVTK
jgi:hypothetical protein